METLSNILQWGGAALVGLGAYMIADRWPSHDVWGKVPGAVGFISMSIDSAIDGARAREPVCFRYDPETFRSTLCPPEHTTIPGALGEFLVESFKDFVGNLLLAGFAIGVALLAAWVMARIRPGDAH